METMNSNDNINDGDSTEEELEIEEKLVFIDFDDKNTSLRDKHLDLSFIGLDQTNPLLKMSGITYTGEWSHPLGTLLFLEGKENKIDPLFKTPIENANKLQYDIKYKTDKILKMSRCVIQKKDDVNNDENNLRKFVKSKERKNNDKLNEDYDESSDEENIDEFYNVYIKENKETNNPIDKVKIKNKVKEKNKIHVDNIVNENEIKIEENEEQLNETENLSNDNNQINEIKFECSNIIDNNCIDSEDVENSINKYLEFQTSSYSNMTVDSLISAAQQTLTEMNLEHELYNEHMNEDEIISSLTKSNRDRKLTEKSDVSENSDKLIYTKLKNLQENLNHDDDSFNFNNEKNDGKPGCSKYL